MDNHCKGFSIQYVSMITIKEGKDITISSRDCDVPYSRYNDKGSSEIRNVTAEIHGIAHSVPVNCFEGYLEIQNSIESASRRYSQLVFIRQFTVS